jgi:Uri superfamily endonuclease
MEIAFPCWAEILKPLSNPPSNVRNEWHQDASKNMTPGSYILIVELDRPCLIQIGKLGSFDFEEGIYAYCGSALNGLESRLRRHFSTNKKTRWHIDYLLEEGKAIEALVLPSAIRLECLLNRLVARMPGSIEPVRGFGSSDCSCRSHLHRLSEEGLSGLRRILDDLSVSFPMDSGRKKTLFCG